MLKQIEGGVCAPKGFRANGVHCGIRKNKIKKDLALIVAEKRCACAGVYTSNLVKGAPILVTQKHLLDGYAQAVVVNSGNANTCNANGIEIAEGMCALVERYTGVAASDVVVASTGVIGQKLSLEPIAGGMDELVKGLGCNSAAAAEAIMTTDTVKKEIAFSFELGGKQCRIGAICKGVGMICPNMATMLMFVTTDGRRKRFAKHAERRSRYLYKRYVLRVGERACGQRRDCRRKRGLRDIPRRAPCGDVRDVQSVGARRRGRDEADRMPRLRREKERRCAPCGEIRDQFQFVKGGDVRVRRELGQGALRARVFGRGSRRQ